ncbi:MAG: sugar transferase [Deltaproteobacteria bacterium]|nr:sugar transferase [Deltaproteobacteria bacterium]
MLRAHAKLIRSLLLALDVLVSALVFVAAVSMPALLIGDPRSSVSLLIPGLVACLAWPLILDQLDLYESQRRRGTGQMLARLALAGCISTALVAATAGLSGAPVLPLFALVVGAGQFLMLSALRLTALAGIRFMRRRGHNFRNVLIVGTGTRARHVLYQLQQHREWGLRVIGFMDEQDTPHDPRIPASRVHKFVDLNDFIREQVVDEVIIACPRSMLGSIGPVVAVCATAGIPMTLLSDLYGDYLPPPRVAHFGSLAALSFAPVHHSRAKLWVKRLMDVMGSAILLAFSAPLIGIAALLIKLDSSGPVFFPQIRCGKNGRTFQITKLRTMRSDAEELKAGLMELNEMDGPVFKIRADPRITRVGRFLRRWSIDELPQFWNVLVGDMSLVGPRPPVPSEVDGYETFDRRRLSMRPGITCLWQVNGRNKIGFADWVKLDLEYIDGWSLWLDLRIMLRTLPAVFRGTGA